ncbi:hypothetical protein ABFX02_08G192861 [Erythranthe guttata]
MIKMAFVLSLILLSFFTCGDCKRDKPADCTKVPIEKLEPCKTYVLGTNRWDKPGKECCNAVRSFTRLNIDQAVVCECYRKSPHRLSYKPDPVRATKLPFSCANATKFREYLYCLVAK